MRLSVALLTTIILFGRSPSAATAQAPVVRADGVAAWGTPVRLLPVGSLGVLDGPPEYALESVRKLVGTRNGDFYIYDAKAVQVRHYAADGKFIGTVGRKGSGPGEYQQLLGLAMQGDSLLVTWDPANLRLSYFGADNRLKRSVRPSIPGVVFGPDVFEVDESGRIIIKYAFRNDSSFYVRLRPDGTVLDTLRGSTAGEPAFVLNLPEGARYNFARQNLVKPSPLGGLLKGSTGVLGFTSEAGGRAVTVQRTSPVIELGKAERAEWERVAEVFNQRGNLSPNKRLTIPPTKPAIRDFFADRDARVWLDVYTTAEQRPATPPGQTSPTITWFERATFDVFSASGKYLGRVVLPPRHELIAVSGDRLWTYSSGPDDEIRIGIFKMVRGSGAPLGS